MLTADAGSDPQASPTARGARVGVVAASVTFVVVATVTQLWRQSGEAMWRTVWAEDGALFYTDALHQPLREIALRPYAGYALLGPRILAAVGVHLPAEWYSYFASIASALVASLLALFVYFASAPLLRSPVRQAVLAGALVLWPALPFEITGVIANTHWMMAVPCLFAVLLPVDRPWAIAVRIPIVVIAPLSSPLCVLFVPIALWQFVRYARLHTRWPSLVVPAVYVAASGAQVVIWRSAEQTNETASSGSLVTPIVKLYGTRVVTELVFGVRATTHLWDHLGYWLVLLAVVGVTGALAWRWWRASVTARRFIVACVLSSIGIYALSLSQRRDFVDLMVLSGDAPYNFIGMRYQLFPAALLLLALLVPLDLPRGAIFGTSPPTRTSLATDVRRQRWVVVFSVLWLFVAFVPSYRLTVPRSGGPDWVDQVDEAQRDCAVHPDASEVLQISPAPAWVVGVTCAELGRGS